MRWRLNDIAKEISARSENISRYRAKLVLNLFLDIVAERLAAGDEIYLRRLGRLHTYSFDWRIPKGERKWYDLFGIEEVRGSSKALSMKFSRYLKNRIKHFKA